MAKRDPQARRRAGPVSPDVDARLDELSQLRPFLPDSVPNSLVLDPALLPKFRHLTAIAQDAARCATIAARRGPAISGDFWDAAPVPMRFACLFTQHEREGPYSGTWLLNEEGHRVVRLTAGAYVPHPIVAMSVELDTRLPTDPQLNATKHTMRRAAAGRKAEIRTYSAKWVAKLERRGVVPIADLVPALPKVGRPPGHSVPRIEGRFPRALLIGFAKRARAFHEKYPKLGLVGVLDDGFGQQWFASVPAGTLIRAHLSRLKHPKKALARLVRRYHDRLK